MRQRLPTGTPRLEDPISWGSDESVPSPQTGLPSQIATSNVCGAPRVAEVTVGIV
jgi:hypothetical protein